MFGFLNKRRLKLICFDIDNTLIDYGAAEAEADSFILEIIAKKTHIKISDIQSIFNETRRKHLHNDVDPKGFSRSLWFNETLKRLNIKTHLDTDKLESQYWDYLIRRINFFPRAIDVLESLKNSNQYKIACITDSDGRGGMKLDRIKRLDLEKYFDYIIVTDDTGKNKPAVENWDKLIGLSGLKGKECMMIGDHPDIDLINAKKRGFITVWTKERISVNIHLRYVDHEITDIGQILDILKKYS